MRARARARLAPRHLSQVVSEALDAELQAPFAAWPAAACPTASKISQRISDLRGLWAASGGAMRGGVGGLPDLLVVKASFAGDAAGFASFMRDVVGGATNLTTRAARFSASGAAAAADDDAAAADDGGGGDQRCAWTTASFGATHTRTELRAVEAPAARAGGWSVAMWSGYVRDLHRKWTANDAGRDRWLDVRTRRAIFAARARRARARGVAARG